MKHFILYAAICILGACSASSPAPAANDTVAASSSASAGSANAQVNAIRAAGNVPALKRNSTLDAVARKHAADMSTGNFFSHTGSDGSNVGKRVSRAGYRWCSVSENINRGYPSGAAAVEAWRTSPGHYRNLVKRISKEYGLANVGDVWVMVLAAKRC